MWCIYVQGLSGYRGDVVTDAKLSRIAGTPRWMIIISVSIVMTLAGALGIVRASNAQLDKVNRIDVVSSVLSPATPGIVNYLIVGSDSRASADPSDPDYETMGSEDENPGNRSDTMIVVRYDTKTKEVAMMSIPRDLWVRIGDGDRYAKVNSAFQKGPDVLVRTLQRALNMPIHHYVDINFAGFKQIVDAIGGVNICVPHATRDKFTGFYIGRKACRLKTGAQALGYARSRHLEEKIDGSWRLDGTGDVGRGNRQRAFMSTLAKDAARYMARHPLDTHNVLTAFASAVSIDRGLDLIDIGQKLRPIGEGTAASVTRPVSSDMSRGTFVFRLANEAQPVLAYFAGLGPKPDFDDK